LRNADCYFTDIYCDKYVAQQGAVR
jgi:hypothetical protein